MHSQRTAGRWEAVARLATAERLPDHLAGDRRLSPVARVLAALHRLQGGGPILVGYRQVAAATGIPFRTVARRMGRLAEMGYLEVLGRGEYVSRTANAYAWHDPPSPVPDTVAATGRAPHNPSISRHA